MRPVTLRLPLALLASVMAATLAPATAFAHPKLVSAAPSASSTVSKPAKIDLVFSETLVAPLSGFELTMTGMPGMANHNPTPIKGFTAKVSGKTISASFPRPLSAGFYDLTWHAVGSDQHRVEGKYSFTVK